jgi:hypothetical protein
LRFVLWSHLRKICSWHLQKGQRSTRHWLRTDKEGEKGKRKNRNGKRIPS